MFEDENQQNTYETERSDSSVKGALTSNSAVKAAMFVIGLMVCIIVIYVLIFAGSTGSGTGSGTATPKPGNTSSATVNPNTTPESDATVTEAPTVAPTPTAEPFSFKKGDESPKVKELQQLLITKGYLDANTELAEVFGAKTETAVKLFQTENGMEATGIVDNALWAAIEAAAVRQEPFELKNGTTDAKVVELQQLLMDKGYMEKDTPTEYFGNKTEAAVKLFQKQNNMTETGIVNNTLFTMIQNAEVYNGATQTQAP